MVQTSITEQAAGPANWTGRATLVLCAGCAGAALFLPTDVPNAIFQTAAWCVGVGLAVALWLEARAGFRALIRVDILMLVALYGLTLLEFLVPQPDFSDVISGSAARTGTLAVLVGFAGIAIGRHAVSLRPSGLINDNWPHLPASAVFLIFMGSFVIGYLHVFLAVNFDLFEALRQMTGPRFSQSWSRGKYGDWTVLVGELGALISLLPPLAGMIFARPNEHARAQKVIVLAVLALTLFKAFSGGTRGTFISYALSFAVGYFLFKKDLKLRQVLPLSLALFASTAIATYFLIEIRTVGLANYSLEESQLEQLFVDNNIIVISRLTLVFPDVVGFLGLEIPYHAITKPIPRAIWPGKPEGLSVGIEDALEAEGLTLAATFIGEAYMAFGLIGVGIAALVLGAMASWWNRVGQHPATTFNLLLYISGFAAAALAMRSILQVAPAMLPTLALWVYGNIWLPKEASLKVQS